LWFADAHSLRLVPGKRRQGVIPPEALRPGAIVSDTREWRWLKPVAWNKGRR